jgi:hypothetical protein
MHKAITWCALQQPHPTELVWGCGLGLYGIDRRVTWSSFHILIYLYLFIDQRVTWL